MVVTSISGVKALKVLFFPSLQRAETSILCYIHCYSIQWNKSFWTQIFSSTPSIWIFWCGNWYLLHNLKTSTGECTILQDHQMQFRLYVKNMIWSNLLEAHHWSFYNSNSHSLHGGCHGCWGLFKGPPLLNRVEGLENITLFPIIKVF